MALSPEEAKSRLSNHNRSLIHFNARSLRKNFDTINNFIASLSHSFTFICISETWLSDSDGNMCAFPSYQTEYCHRMSDSHGGTAIFISSDVPYMRRHDLSLNVSLCESVWIEVDRTFLSHNNKNFILGCIYRSPSSSLTDFLLGLDVILNKLTAENKDVLLVGDININLLDTEANLCTAYTDCFSGFGFESLINVPTRCTPQGSRTLIDHALCNISPPPHSAVVDVDVTDHFPIFLTFNTEAPCRNTTYFTSLFDCDKFIETIGATQWATVKSVCDAEEALKQFSSLFVRAVSLSTTTVKCKKKYKYPGNPWMTSGLLESIRKKDNLYRKTKRQPFNSNLARRYKMYCSLLNRLLKQAKKRYYENEFVKNKNNPKQQWNLLNAFLSTTKNNAAVSKITHNGMNLNQPIHIANAFSDYFSSSYTQTCQNINVRHNIRRASQSFFLFPVTENEVFATISSLNNTSAGLDKISIRHLKLVAHLISDTLSSIINLIFKSGVFPSFLKKAKVIPVFKKGDRLLISNYRPISILPTISKIIERLFAKRLNSYLSKFNLLNECQFGFRSGRSTNLALLSLTDYIKKSIDSGNFVGSVFLDLSKAFDTINHDVLFQKLEAYGVTGPALTFLKSYLLNRQFTVYVADTFSETKTFNQGVPQGSILGPLLFNLYINDLPNLLQSYHCILYADDTTISLSDESIISLTSKLNTALNNVVNWCHDNYLSINPEKTKFMIFRTFNKQITILPDLMLGPHSIAPCNHTTFLGVELDPSLTFCFHFSHLKQKTAFGIRALLKARPFFPHQALLSLYFAFVHSHINYGIASWGNAYSSHLSSVQHIQNQCIRIITCSSHRSSASALLRENKILSVNNLFHYNLGVFFYQLLHSYISYDSIDLNRLRTKNCTRFAANNNFLLPSVHTNYGKKTSCFAAISFWNSLPLTVKSLSSITSFKNSLKNFLL